MTIYDTIGASYRNWRSADIGVSDINDLVEKYSVGSVLDLGCGNGFPIAEAVEPQVNRYLGVDSSAVLLEEFKHNVPAAEAILSPIELLDLNGETFDLVFSFGCIFHLPPEAQMHALQIAAYAVSPGGVLSFNSGAEEGSTTGHVGDYQLDHWSLGEQAYVALLTDCGLHYQGSHMGPGQNLFFTYTKS